MRIDANPTNASFVATQIADYASKNSFDLILTGRESIDYNGSQVAAMVGELLNIPSVSIVKSLEVADKTVTLSAKLKEERSTFMPYSNLLQSATEGIAEPRIPNMRYYECSYKAFASCGSYSYRNISAIGRLLTNPHHVHR